MCAASTQSRFQRNIVRIATGTALSQGIVIAAMPALSRLYRPEDFGALAVFTSVHVILAALFTLKYELAIILPAENDAALRLIALTLTTSLLWSGLLLLGLSGASLLGMSIESYYFLLPLSAALVAATACGQQWSARAGDYRRYARGQVLNSLMNVMLALGLLAAPATISGKLVLSYVAGLVVSTVYVCISLAQDAKRRRAEGLVSPDILLRTAREYVRFPILVLPTSLLATIGTTALPFVLQSMFSLREVGFFAIASRLLLVPGVFIGNAVSEAFRSEFVSHLRDGGVMPIFQTTLRKLTLLAFPAFALVFVLAPTLFAIVFGPDYRESGILSRYLCLGVAAQFISQPFAYVFVATDHTSQGLLVQGAATAGPIIGVLLGGLYGDMHLAVQLYSVATLGSSALLVLLARRCCLRSDARLQAGAQA